MQDKLTVLALLLLAGGPIVNGAALNRKLFTRQSAGQQFAQFQGELQAFASDVSTLQTGLGSSSTCKASSGKFRTASLP